MNYNAQRIIQRHHKVTGFQATTVAAHGKARNLIDPAAMPFTVLSLNGINTLTKMLARILLLACFGFAFGGCASHSTQIVARCGPRPFSPTTKNIALMQQSQVRPQDQSLAQEVIAQLKGSGYRIVPQAEAEYVLSCLVEDNWERHLHPSTEASRNSMWSPVPSPTGVFYRDGNQSYLAWQYFNEPVEDYVPTQGIRLRLYESQSLRAGHFDTAWEGYIDAGRELRPEEQAVLLKTLLPYLGHDFLGRVKLPQ